MSPPHPLAFTRVTTIHEHVLNFLKIVLGTPKILLRKQEVPLGRARFPLATGSTSQCPPTLPIRQCGFFVVDSSSHVEKIDKFQLIEQKNDEIFYT